MDFLEKEYGIKEGQSYKITYENDVRESYYIKKCLILNFTPNQIIAKSDKGLHIFKPRYITEMKPLDKLKEVKLTLKGFEDGIVGQEANMVDVDLTPLHVGDVVSTYVNNVYRGEKVIAYSYNEYFVMGCGGTKIIEGVGKISNDRTIRIHLSKSYKEFKAGDTVDKIEFVEIK